MDELKAVEELGVATSPEIQSLLDKSLRNVIKQLNGLEVRGMIKVIEIRSERIRKRLYVKNEVYHDICKIA